MLGSLSACDEQGRAMQEREDFVLVEDSVEDVAATDADLLAPMPDLVVRDFVEPPIGPPPCNPALAAGEVRFEIEGVAGRVAIGADGTLYAPLRTAENGRDLAAFDVCGELLWQAPAIDGQDPGIVMRPNARLSADGRYVVLSNTGGYGQAYTLRCYDTASGLEGVCPWSDALEGWRISAWIGWPPGRGPIGVFFPNDTIDPHLLAFAGDGALLVDLPDVRADHEECALALDGTTIVCYDVAFDLFEDAPRWEGGGDRLVDGTLRHVVPPALANGLLHTVVYGVSTYRFVTRDAATGDTVVREALGPSSLGQSDLRIGAPVVGVDGTVYVYLNIHRENELHRGELMALDPVDGSRRWTHLADATEQDFFRHATHTLGTGSRLYFAIGSEVSALDAQSGEVVWQRTDLGTAFNHAGPVLSPNGDLAVRSDDDRLFVLATDSIGGSAPSEWPAPGGDRRNANAR